MHCLFVGNSYTFYNDMPAQVASLMREAGAEVAVSVAAEGGANLEKHEERAETRDALANLPWTHLVIQEQSTRPLHDRDKFLDSLDRLCAVAGQRPITLYQTWARQVGHEVYRSSWSGKSPEAMTERLEDAYREAADRLREQGRQVRVAPVGATWYRSLSQFPQLNLFDEDGHHASAAGSHLAALVIAAALAEDADIRGTVFAPDALLAEDAATLRQTLV